MTGPVRCRVVLEIIGLAEVLGALAWSFPGFCASGRA